jgi:hypothetical protein
VVVVLVGGCDPMDGAPGNNAPIVNSDATAQLAGLAVAPWTAMTGFSRDRFPHWVQQGGGCDTRETVLRREGQGVVTGANCEVTQGTWVSVYDGLSVTDPKSLDIDHMVPLGNAWRTGAKDWTDQHRSEFANDLTRPQLLAVTATTNRSKGDQDPAHWKPPRHEYWCTYAQRWVAVKSYWKLWVTAEEKQALQDMLGTCAAQQ